MNQIVDAKLSLDSFRRPWRRALLWLLLLGPFFFVSYGLANDYASHRAHVGSIVFGWEHAIPFLPWTIIPYWLIDLMYAASLFVCANQHELDTHARRLLTAQIIAVTCFILFPLSYSFSRPETTGVTGAMFAALSSFDKPYNQAPSLHIALLIVLWVKYQQHLPRIWHAFLHGVCVLIGISVLTTYQHHFIDIPTGLLLGWLCIWLWPEGEASPLRSITLVREPRRWRIAGYYLFAAMIFAVLAFVIQGAGLWLLWPSVSLLMVASFYAVFGEKGFQKQVNGRLSDAATWLLLPYLIGARINSRMWLRSKEQMVHVCDGVWLGRFPSGQDLTQHHFKHVIDLTAELVWPRVGIAWHVFPSLDLLPPERATLSKVADLIEKLQPDGPVLVTCALGYSRSAMAILTWLLRSRRVSTLQEGVLLLKMLRPGVVIPDIDQSHIAVASQLQAGSDSADEC